MLHPDLTKTCPRCSERKLATGNFYKSGKSSDGYAGYCISCTKEAAKSWQNKLPEDRRRSKSKADWQRRKHDPEAARKHAEQQKLWADKNRATLREKHRAWSKAYKGRDPVRARQQNAVSNNRQRCKRLGYPPERNSFQWVDWLAVLDRFEACCAFCGAGDCALDLEHLQPIQHGGANAVGNVVPACRPCNAQKFTRTLDEFAALRGLTAPQLAAIRSVAAGE